MDKVAAWVELLGKWFKELLAMFANISAWLEGLDLGAEEDVTE